MISKTSRKLRKAFAKWNFFTCYGLGQTPQYHLSSCGAIFIHQRRSKLQLMALNRSPTLLIDHRCSHPTRQFFNYNHIAHDCESSRHYAVKRHKARRVSPRPPPASQTWWQSFDFCGPGSLRGRMINGSDPIPPSCARPPFNPANPISQCCRETTPWKTRCHWMGHQRPSWAPKDHSGYISIRWLQSQICRLLQAAAAICREGLMDGGQRGTEIHKTAPTRKDNMRWFTFFIPQAVFA